MADTFCLEYKFETGSKDAEKEVLKRDEEISMGRRKVHTTGYPAGDLYEKQETEGVDARTNLGGHMAED